MKLTEIATIKALCEEYGFGFKKKFGQNFLVNARVPAMIAESSEGTCALEIGPGIGTMTRELAEICPKVVAIEIDTTLQPLLETTLSDLENVEVVFADAMKTDIAALCKEKFGDSPVSVCANLPYYITTPVILHLLECGVKFKSLTFMIQKEVADRLCAKAGTAEYGAITLTCARYGKVKKLFDVPRSAFYPVPGVDSTVVTILPEEKEEIYVKDEKALTRLIRASFNQRRKTLVNGMSGEFSQYNKQELADLLVSCGFRADVRGETLSLADFAKIVNAMQK